MGLPGIRAASILVRDFSLPLTAEQYYAKSHEMVMREFRRKTDLIDGAEKLVKHLYTHRIPIAVLTFYR